MREILLVAAGGALGATGRYLVGLATLRLFGPGWPAGTFAVNLIGSFVMGLAFAWLAPKGPEGARIALLLMTGMLGGFTTFSAFSLDLWLMIEDERFWSAIVYALLSVVLSLTALAGGISLMRSVAS